VLLRRFEARTDEQQQVKEVISNYNYRHAKEPSVSREIPR
jgi:hypothetical protein